MEANTKKTVTLGINLKNLLIGLCFMGVLLSPPSLVSSWASETDKDLTLTIIHTNDLHAHEEPFLDNGKMVGGMSRIGYIVRSLKKKFPDALTVDAGDMFQGSLLYSKFKGDIEVNLLNKIGYDIYTIGNHEFDDGAKNLAQQLEKAKFDIINCNLDAGAVPQLEKLIKSSVVKKIGGQSIGFVGAMTPEFESVATNLQGVKLKAKHDQWIQPIREEVAKLKGAGVDKIVLVTHCGLDAEKQLAAKIPEVDAIIGGHSHTRLEKPIIVKHHDGTSTTIVQTGCYGRAVGFLQLTFDDKGVVKQSLSKYRLFDVTADTVEAGDLKEYIEKAAAPFAALTREIVGTASDYFEKRNSLCDTSMGDIVCDAVRDSGRDYGVTIAFHNRGGIRGVLQKGPISVAQIEQILPFENYVVYATVTGKVIRRVVEHSLADGLGGHFADVSGLKIIWDKSKPSGERTVLVLADDGKGHYNPIEDEQTYKMAMNHYNFEGGESYDFKGATDVVKTKTRIADALAAYIRKHPDLTPQKPNRIVCVKEGALHIKNDGSDKTLISNDAPASARISIVAGTGPGVSTIYNAFPVPLADAQVLKTGLKASSTGNFYCKSLTRLLQAYRSDGEKGQKASWVSIVAHPSRRDSDHTLVAAPVSIR